MQTSEQINEIAAALAKAQAAIVNPDKDSENPAFKQGGKVSRYAGLADALVIIRKELSAVGVAVLQAPRIEGDAQVLDTRLVHSSGQWVGCEWPIGRGGTQHQLGSGLTYARRYSIFSLVGIAGADDDDDGNEASGKAPIFALAPAPASVEKITKLEADMLETGLERLDSSIRKRILKREKVERIEDIRASSFRAVSAFINDQLGELQKAAE